MVDPAQPAGRLPPLWRHLWSWVVGVLLVVWTTLLMVAWYTGHHEAEEVTDGQLVAVARLWLPVVTGPTQAAPEAIGENRARAYVQDVAVIRWQGAQLLTDTHGLATSLGLEQPPAAGFSQRLQDTPAGQAHWRLYVAEKGDARVAVIMNMDQRLDLARDMALKLARPALFILPLVALLLWWALQRGLRPLDRLSSDVAALDGLAGQRLDTAHRFREFSSTVSAINSLVDSLQARARRERGFASDVAHELRTPLAALTLQAGAARHDPSPERLAQLEATALRAGHILAQLLDLARAQRGGSQGEDPAWKPVALGDLVANLVASHAPAGFQSGHELSLDQPEDVVTVRTQPLLLEPGAAQPDRERAVPHAAGHAGGGAGLAHRRRGGRFRQRRWPASRCTCRGGDSRRERPRPGPAPGGAHRRRTGRHAGAQRRRGAHDDAVHLALAAHIRLV